MGAWAVLALDPGDEYSGVAVMDSVETQVSTETCEMKGRPEMLGHLALSFATDMGLTYERCVLVVESFALYPDKSAEQSWSEFLTPQGIGAARFAWSMTPYEFVLQGANIKKPTEAQLRGRGIQTVGGNRHERDAELHLWHYVLKSGLWLAAAANNN